MPHDRLRHRSACLPCLLAVLAFLLCRASPAGAQGAADCLVCHEDEGLKARRADGTEVSCFVDAKRFAASAHAAKACTGCHTDLAGKDGGHEGMKPAKVACGACHKPQQESHAASLHGAALAKGDKLAPDCAACHGAHDILRIADPASAVGPLRVPFVCGSCHEEGKPVQVQRRIHEDHILQNYGESIHGEGLLKKGLVVSATCTSCHTAHRILRHTDRGSSIARANIAATCTRCHARIEDVHRKIIKGELWEKEASVLPACVDCHQPHKARKVYYDQGMADKDCLRCHADPGLKAADGRGLLVDEAAHRASAHRGVSCSQCHSKVAVAKARPCETLTGTKVDCGSCHVSVFEQYHQSTHGRLAAAGNVIAPGCKDCHGTHGVLAKKDPASPAFPTNVPILCGRCHQDGMKAALLYTGPEKDIVDRYTESIHGKGLLKSGLTVTATCTSCHTAHRELPQGDPASSVNRANVARTCGTCHHGIEEVYSASIHATAKPKDGRRLPACNDCHSAHTIDRTDGTGFKLAIMGQCGTCHERVAATYFDTYHGKVSQLGYAKTAKCFDCHGSHGIQPVGDPRSTLHRNNVVQTCGKCHAGATRRFAGYLSHATHHDPDRYPWLFWTFWAMTALLVGTFTASGLHTLLWLPRALQMRRLYAQAHAEDAASGGRQYQRFTRLNRVQHVLMIVSFIALAFTGMTLKFSYTTWAAAISRLLGGFETAGAVHRAAACLMVGVFASHLCALVAKRYREYDSWFAMVFGKDTMLPTWRDLREFFATLRWFVGAGERPNYGRWTYWEKFDYFAVFWGMFIIGSTGFILWFPEFFTRFLPGWFLNVATIVHSDEALLATGFIFTVHFFNTHLRPEKFPMDTVVFSGRMPLGELKRDKPDEYEALVEAGELDRHLVEAHPASITRLIRAFAWTALVLGFGMVVWIVYAMAFAYQ